MHRVTTVSLVTGVTVELCCLETIPAFGNGRFSGVLGSEKLFYWFFFNVVSLAGC